MDQKVRAQVLFNSEAVLSGLSTGWGLSFLLDDRILFDTADNPENLLGNMKRLKIDPFLIDTVIISHDHWDHTGGLTGLLKINPKMRIYICSGYTREFAEKTAEYKDRLILSDKLTKITENVFLTGKFDGTYKGKNMPEQAVIVRQGNLLTVLTGCAHPGIVYMLRMIKKMFPGDKINSIFGGFHLLDKDEKVIDIIIEKFRQMGIMSVGPTHCSGLYAQEAFKKEYKDAYVELPAGAVVMV